MSVDWHADDEQLFQAESQDTCIVSLSLGVARAFVIRPKWPEGGERPHSRVTLEYGDVCVMEGMMQKTLPAPYHKGGPHRGCTHQHNVAKDTKTRYMLQSLSPYEVK